MSASCDIKQLKPIYALEVLKNKAQILRYVETLLPDLTTLTTQYKEISTNQYKRQTDSLASSNVKAT